MAEQHVRINGKTFLYKQKAPFEASGMSVFAAIEYDPEEDKLRCHECGDWFENLVPHVFQRHGITGRAYKIKHGLTQKTALLNEELRIALSRRSTAMNAAHPERHRESFRKAVAALSGRRTGTKRQRGEIRNERGACPPQLLVRIKKLAAKVGHTPSQVEMSEAGISPRSACFALNVKTIGAVTSLADLVPNERSPRAYSDVVLIEKLRDFYVHHGRLPRWGTDSRRGLIPSVSPFYRAFGSLKKAYRAAGLGLVAAAGGGK